MGQLEPAFETMEARQIVGLSRRFTMDRRHEIPGLWQEVFAAPWSIENEVTEAMYGTSYEVSEDGSFSYHVGAEARPPANLAEGVCVVTLRAGRYAVFRQQAPMSEIPGTFDAIFSTWLPNADVTLDKGAVFERYPSGGAEETPPRWEVWVPIKDA